MLMKEKREQRHHFNGVTWIIAVSALTVTLWSGSIATANGAPAKLDSNEGSLPLELQPPLFVNIAGDAAAPFADNEAYDREKTAIDSYGNPIESLKPIDTPDGRKVISAQGLQFEIPNYASGITDIKKPDDDLLPPFIDPIAVALPNDSAVPEVAETTRVDVENADLVEITTANQDDQGSQEQQQNEYINVGDRSNLPSYLLELNDPDIGGPVDYVLTDFGSGPKVIAWDLLPPNNDEPQIVTVENSTPKKIVGAQDPVSQNVRFSLSSGTGLRTQNVAIGSTQGRVSAFPLGNQVEQPSSTETTTKPSTARPNYRGTVHFTSTTQRPTTQRTTTSTTTTTRRPTTTTTTTRKTTTTTPAPTTSASTTFAPTTPAITVTTEALDPSEFYRLEAGDSYTLPSWLADVDDPELDIAVTYVVPTDLNDYNQTVETDLVPPFEPFVDLNNINLTPPAEVITTPSPTTQRTTTTTRRPSTTTRRISTTSATQKTHWVRTNNIPTTPKGIVQNFNSRNSINNIAQTQTQSDSLTTTFTTNSIPNTQTASASAFASANQTPPQSSIATTEATAPINSLPHQASFNQNIPTTTADPISSSEVAAAQQNQDQRTQTRPTNAFLQPGAYNNQPKPFSKSSGFATTTTTTTTTITPATPVEENPFDSATVPAWLSAFDYPDIGPGVPFIYDPNAADSDDVQNDLQPPTNIDATDTSKPVFVVSSPTSYNPLQSTKTFVNQQTSSKTPSTSFASSDPSKVTLPLPSIKANQNDNVDVTELPVFFTPPTHQTAKDTNINIDADSINGQVGNVPSVNNNAFANRIPVKVSSSTFNTNFAAPFEPASDAVPTGQPIPADKASFPPVPNVGLPSKTTFTKSSEGKVIQTSVPIQPQTAPTSFNNGFRAPSKGFGNQPNQFFTTAATQQSSFAANSLQSSTSTFAGSSFNKVSSQPTGFSSFQSTVKTAVASSGSDGASGKYTGGFGGAPGVLGSGKVGFAVRNDGSIRDPDHTYRPPTQVATASQSNKATPLPAQGTRFGVGAGATSTAFGGFANRGGVATATATNSNGFKYQGRFGGPPGVLIPYDNVKATRP